MTTVKFEITMAMPDALAKHSLQDIKEELKAGISDIFQETTTWNIAYEVSEPYSELTQESKKARKSEGLHI